MSPPGVAGEAGFLGGDIGQSQPVQRLASGELGEALGGFGLDGELGGRLRR
jgi:hypothetical protein